MAGNGDRGWVLRRVGDRKHDGKGFWDVYRKGLSEARQLEQCSNPSAMYYRHQPCYAPPSARTAATSSSYIRIHPLARAHLSTRSTSSFAFSFPISTVKDSMNCFSYL